MIRWIIFTPLAGFVVYALYHLASGGDRPFLLRWIDLSMAFTFALVLTLVFKHLLLKQNDHHENDQRDT